MDWAAIDFETANADRASACALGLVVVQEALVVKRRSWLIRPFKVCFDPNNVMIHGITADQLADKPSFAELWDEVHSEIQGMPLVAHNASFDISVLRHTLDHYKIGTQNWTTTAPALSLTPFGPPCPATGWSSFRAISAYRSHTTQSKRTQWLAQPSCFVAVARLELRISPNSPNIS
jgi:DNA polymerase III epsilon subunit-like protein